MASAGILTNRWIELRRPGWTRLEQLTRSAESGGLKTLSVAELRELGLLYRQTAADLSAARTDQGSRTLEDYLNRLVGRAHNFVYSGRALSVRTVGQFLAWEYPRVFRRLFPYVVTALVLFLLGALLGTLMTLARPAFMEAVLGPQMIDTIQHHKMWTESVIGAEPQAASAIMTNNITVCFMAFAGGIVAGVGTIFLMISNGLEIGVVAVACAQHGMSLSLWSFVAAHGSLELPSIFIAGGAGLRLAGGLLFPGYLRRRDAVAEGGREAVRLLSGTIPLLIVAGTIEGFLSPSHAPIALKFGVCAVLFTGLCAWLSEGWRARLAE